MAPPMPPIAPQPKLRRINSSTLSLNKHKRKMLTLEDLYVEILYTILHMIGCDADQQKKLQLIQHLQNAFFMEQDKHQQLLDIASMREEPDLKVNLEIMEARNLIGKDMSGSSDPFCTFYLTTNPKSRYNTSYKSKTLNPQWNEECVLNVNSVDNDCLRVDVWDFNPEEKVGDKFRKINEIKDSRGLRKFIKETLNATTGTIQHDLIGSVEIPLNDIPTSGIDKWYALQKPEVNSSRGGKKRDRGDIRICMSLSTEKDQNFVPQEYRHLLRTLFTYELYSCQAEAFTWNGTFSRDSVTILSQHAVQGNLTVTDTALARWLVYAHTHNDLPLDYRVFVPVLEQLKTAMTNNQFCQDDESRFIETATVFINDCMSFLKSHRNIVSIHAPGGVAQANADDAEVANTQHHFIQLEHILKCLKILHDCLEDAGIVTNGNGYGVMKQSTPPPVITSGRTPTAPSRLKRLREDSGGEQSGVSSATEPDSSGAEKSIPDQVEEAIGESILVWYNYIVEKMPRPSGAADRGTDVKNSMQLVRLILSDLKGQCQTLQALFTKELEIDYCSIAFAIYDENMAKLVRPVAESACGSLKQVTFTENLSPEAEKEITQTLKFGTSLFELYLDIQSFVSYGASNGYFRSWISATLDHDRTTKLYHTWFSRASTRWLDIALYKAMERITKAVNLDDLTTPVTDRLHHSASAVDLKTVLIQIKTFWKELNWPDPEESYALISKILDDVCKVSIFYADRMCAKVAEKAVGESAYANTRRFEVKPQQCLAINNIDDVLKFIRPFAVKDLGIDEILGSLQASSENGEAVVRSCRRTLMTLIQNAVENVENKIFEVLEGIGSKMAPVIQRFMVEGTARSIGGQGAGMLVVDYLDKNLVVLKENLNKENFDRIRSVIWESSAQKLDETIQASISRRQPQSYFTALLETLNILIEFFYGGKQQGNPQQPQDETLLKMKRQLQLYASDSPVLISRYLSERYKKQREVKAGEFVDGSITLRCQILREHLRIEVLNARHLKPPDPIAIRMNENNKLVSKHRAPPLSTHSRNNLVLRSQRNLQWVKSKWKSLRTNLHEASIQFHTTTLHAGQCDPYISLRLVPTTNFPHCPKQKTRTKRRTLFPLFDETFDFVIQYEKEKFASSYLLITVKDNSLVGGGVFLGEALLPLSEVKESSIDQNLAELPQIQLPLTKPSRDQDSDVIRALDSRGFDRLAKDFLQKEKRKV